MKRKTAAILLGMIVSASLIIGCGSNEATEAASQGEQTGGKMRNRRRPRRQKRRR